MSTTKATRDVLDLATRPVTNLQCTGGNIDGTEIGGTTPDEGFFTNLEADSVTISTTLDVTGATIIGTIYAYYAADFAEEYEADREYAPGTVVQIGGVKEITEATDAYEVFGVISTNPSYVLNALPEEGKIKLPVALTGRVPVRVIGPVRKGQRLVLSRIPGVAEGALIIDARAVVGRAIGEYSGTEEGVVEAAVRINL